MRVGARLRGRSLRPWCLVDARGAAQLFTTCAGLTLVCILGIYRICVACVVLLSWLGLRAGALPAASAPSVFYLAARRRSVIASDLQNQTRTRRGSAGVVHGSWTKLRQIHDS